MVLRCVVVAAVGLSLAATAPAEARKASGTVLYEQRDCYAGKTRTNVPVEGVPIVIDPPVGKKIEDQREVRDAMALGVEKTAADDHFDNELFWEAGMGWGLSARLFDAEPDADESYYAQVKQPEVWLEGAYGTCRSNSDDPSTPIGPPALNSNWSGAVALGALPFTYVDDCLVSYGNGFVSLVLPILPGERQLTAPISVMARWVCEPAEDPGEQSWNDSDPARPYNQKYFQCGASRLVTAQFAMGVGTTGGPGSKNPATPDPTRIAGGVRVFSETGQLPTSATQIARVSPDGKCLFIQTDCSD